MANSKSMLESCVIRDYLNGKTRKQISEDNNTSTGNVSNITNEWKRRIGKPEAEEIRELVSLVRKSGLSVKQCADGYRTMQLMKISGIIDDNDNDKDNSEEFVAFVKDVYLNCKNADIPPAILVKWIRDLFDCFSVGNYNNNNSFSFANNWDDEEDGKYNEDTQPDMPQYQHPKLQLEFDEPLGDIQPNVTTRIKNLSSLSYTNSLTQEGSADPLHSTAYSTNRIKIPLISHVSGFIAQRRLESSKIKKYNAYLENKTKRAELQQKLAKQRLATTIKIERQVMHYLEWFYRLKEELWDNHSIRIEEISRFAKVISDFKRHNYNPYEIIKEHSDLASVTQELATKTKSVESLKQQERLLIRQLVSLDARLSIHNQTMDTFEQLKAMGFGLAELKQIWTAVLEISSHR
jgi:hypothetical protein